MKNTLIIIALSLTACSEPPCDPFNAGPFHPMSNYRPCDPEEFRKNHDEMMRKSLEKEGETFND